MFSTPAPVGGCVTTTPACARVETKSPEPCDPNLSAPDRKRLKVKLGALLAALREGPKTNIELVPVCGLRASARVHDLRESGFRVTASNQGGGIWLYTLEE